MASERPLIEPSSATERNLSYPVLIANCGDEVGKMWINSRIVPVNDIIVVYLRDDTLKLFVKDLC